MILLGSATAELYQWVDEKGVIHFSDKKPPNIDSNSKHNKANKDNSQSLKRNAKKGIVWHKYTEGLQLSKKTGKGAIIIFYATWCPTCKKYMQLFDDQSIIKESQKFIMIRVDQDKQPNLSSKFNFDGKYIPRTFAVSPSGNIIHEMYPQKSKYRYFIGTSRSNLFLFMKMISDFI